MPHPSKKTTMVFTLDLLMRAFFGRELFVRIPHFAFGLVIVVEHPWFISCYYFTQKIWLNFESSQQIMTNFQPVHSLPHRRVFRHQFCMCKCSVRILWAAFLFKPVSSAIILTLNRWSFAITARTTSTFWSFVDEIGLLQRGSFQLFIGPLWKLCAT